MSDNNEQIIEAVERLEQGGADARVWVDRVRGGSASVANQADSLIELTRRARLAARRIGGSMHRRNCVGVFGPSQAGKSYLVSALAKRKDSPLILDFGGVQLDFLKEVNPAGDRESTGLVSRFTKHAGPSDPDFPVELRLLSETDLVKIFANSFLSDFDTNNMDVELPDEDAIREIVRELEGGVKTGAVAVPHLDEIELFDLGEYFRQNFRSRIGQLDRAGYWDAIIRIGGRLPTRLRARLFAMLWGNLEPFTEMFIMLATALESLGNAKEARAGLNSLTPREAGSPPEPSTIIDVTILKRLGTERDSGDTVAVRPVGSDGQAIQMPRATMCALTAEVKLVIQEAPWPFMEHTDLLDFPGARSRLKLRNLGAGAGQEDEDGSPRELFLRGKIAYLFQRYTAEIELTSMLLCMPPSNQEVKDLAGMVRSWIEATHGATPKARARIQNALFLVLTKVDQNFEETGGETVESRKGKWDRRLFASFLELYGRDEWVEDWSGSAFDNSVFVRNPNIKQKHLMDYSDESSLTEIGPAAASTQLISELKEAFSSSALVARHFAERDGVWDAMMTPNDGGVEYLVGRLSQVLDPGLKQRQGSERLLEMVDRLDDALRVFHHGDGEQAREERDKRIQEARRALLGAIRQQDYRGFAHLVSALGLPEGDVRGVFFNVAAMREEDFNQVVGEEVDGSADDPWAAEDDPWAADDSPTEASPSEGPSSRRRERPDIFAEQAVGHWQNRMNRLLQDPAQLRMIGVPEDVVGEIIKDLRIGADRLGLTGRIADAVREETLTAGARWEDAADRAVRIASFEINDFIGYLGFGRLETDERPGFPEAPREPKRRIFDMPDPDPTNIGIGGTRSPMEANFFVDWGVAWRELGLNNVSHDSGREISEEDNRELGRIIAMIDVSDSLRVAGVGSE
jgi:hypothetical protein